MRCGLFSDDIVYDYYTGSRSILKRPHRNGRGQQSVSRPLIDNYDTSDVAIQVRTKYENLESLPYLRTKNEAVAPLHVATLTVKRELPKYMALSSDSNTPLHVATLTVKRELPSSTLHLMWPH